MERRSRATGGSEADASLRLREHKKKRGGRSRLKLRPPSATSVSSKTANPSLDSAGDIEDYANERGIELVTVYDEGKRSSGFDTDRPEYTALCEHVADGSVDTVIVPNLSRLSRDRKERLRLLLDVDTAGVAVHSVELGRAVDLDDNWALVHQSIRVTTDDVEKRKEIARSKRATHERIENEYDHGRPPFGLTYDDSGHYWVPDRNTDEYQAALVCISLREDITHGAQLSAKPV